MIAWHGTTQIRLSEADLKLAIQRYLNHTEYSNTTYDVDVIGVTFHKKGGKYPATFEVKRRANSK